MKEFAMHIENKPFQSKSCKEVYYLQFTFIFIASCVSTSAPPTPPPPHTPTYTSTYNQTTSEYKYR